MKQSHAQTTQKLLTYEEIAPGGKPVPLMLRSLNYKKTIPSNYFTDSNLAIAVQSTACGEVNCIKIGEHIKLTLEQVTEGFVFRPFNLVTAHSMQLLDGYIPEKGGTLKFGYLNNILMGLLLSLGHFFLSIFQKQKTSSDISSQLMQIFGEKYWQEFEIEVQMIEGKWTAFHSFSPSEKIALGKITTFLDVNSHGVCTGLNRMVATPQAETMPVVSSPAGGPSDRPDAIITGLESPMVRYV